MKQVEYTGINNFKKQTFEVNTETKQHHVHTEFIDVDFEPNRTIDQVFADHLAKRNTRVVDVLYSGGLDSEMVLASCLNNKIPCRAVTLRMTVGGVAINTHDLYYAERFCRQRGVEHVVIDLDVEQFYTSGEFLQYCEPYLNKEFHVTTHLWLLERCSGFPVVGGFYPWPWHHGPKVVSPTRAAYSFYHRFMQDRGISGIDNMQCHSLESVILYITAHLKTAQTYDNINHPHFKQKLFASMGFDLEPRMRSYGWEEIAKSVFNKDDVNRVLIDKFGTWTNSVSWGHTIANALGGQPGYWDRFN